MTPPKLSVCPRFGETEGNLDSVFRGRGGGGGEVFPGVFHIKMIMWGVFNISFFHKIFILTVF